MIYTRQDFADYCLRSLGAPVVEINIDDTQLEDRIDEALLYWQLYHNEGVEKMYLKQKLNCSVLKLASNNAEYFKLGSILKGQTSGATAQVVEQIDKKSEGSDLIVRFVKGEFVSNETIVADQITGQLTTTDFYIPGEIEQKWIQLPDYIFGVTRVLPLTGTQTSKSMFDIQYQLRLNDLYDLTSTSIVYYTQVMQHLSLLDLELNGKPMFRFNRIMGRIFIDTNWEANIIPGSFIVLECYRALDPSSFYKVWNEPWLKSYTSALIKKQWGTNLKKFSGIQLPGGVTLDGQSMYTEAMDEIRNLIEELQMKSAPLEFFMG
jgi:hypothetical protein